MAVRRVGGIGDRVVSEDRVSRVNTAAAVSGYPRRSARCLDGHVPWRRRSGCSRLPAFMGGDASSGSTARVATPRRMRRRGALRRGAAFGVAAEHRGKMAPELRPPVCRGHK